jgi:hypothetical protein
MLLVWEYASAQFCAADSALLAVCVHVEDTGGASTVLIPCTGVSMEWVRETASVLISILMRTLAVIWLVSLIKFLQLKDTNHGQLMRIYV